MIGAGTMMFGPSSAFAPRHPPAARTVEAEEFVLLGPNRARRGVIEVSNKGTAALYPNDENGKERAELTVAADGRGLNLRCRSSVPIGRPYRTQNDPNHAHQDNKQSSRSPPIYAEVGRPRTCACQV
jgi:hypothetical protein